MNGAILHTLGREKKRKRRDWLGLDFTQSRLVPSLFRRDASVRFEGRKVHLKLGNLNEEMGFPKRNYFSGSLLPAVWVKCIFNGWIGCCSGPFSLKCWAFFLSILQHETTLISPEFLKIWWWSWEFSPAVQFNEGYFIMIHTCVWKEQQVNVGGEIWVNCINVLVCLEQETSYLVIMQSSYADTDDFRRSVQLFVSRQQLTKRRRRRRRRQSDL